MYRKLKSLTICFLLCLGFLNLSAQHSFSFNNGPVMRKYQDSLQNLSNFTFEAKNNTERFALNAAFIKTLVNSLKTPHSFHYNFDSLQKVSILKSPDNSFRILTWYLPVDDGSYRFFGTIQIATSDGKLKLYPLVDNTEQTKDVNAVTGNKNWYGARYYEIVPVVVSGRQPYYVLVGWKGNNAKTSKKVIDVLSFEKGEPVFGKAVFDGLKGSGVKNRVIFEYNKLNSMTLTMDKSVNMIVFDHLAPFTADMEGNFEYYASDLSFDAYKITNGRLKLVENVELKNDPTVMDDFYINPEDKNIKPVKKL
ncbi:MAG: hypothetical protein V4594_23780 [Bacteroidota bacterium]